LIRFRLAAPRRRGDTLWDAVGAAWAPASSPSAVNLHQYTRAPDFRAGYSEVRIVSVEGFRFSPWEVEAVERERRP